MRPPFDALDKGAKRIARGPDGSELVPADMTYYEWLKTQPASFQNDAIGPRRAELLRNGGLSAKRFSELNLSRNFQPLTLEEMKRVEPGAFERAEKIKDEKELRDAKEDSILSISSPIESARHMGKGEPWAIEKHDKPLNNQQQALLDKLPEYDSRVTVKKDEASMTDLAALTAKTGNEFAMFTRGAERLVVRGNDRTVKINFDDAKELNAQGYRWSGHTHTTDNVMASEGDHKILSAFEKKWSVIYSPTGKLQTFDSE